MIASIHRTSLNAVERIIVYNLGLRWWEKYSLNLLHRVTVIDYPPIAYRFFDGYLDPRGFAYKCFALWDAGKYGEYIFWLDAGAMALKDIKSIYDIIKKEDIFLVEDRGWRNFQWTTPQCLDIIKATEKEKNDFHLSAGILGYKVNGKYQKLVNEAFNYSKIKECIHGPRKIKDPYMPFLRGHRHDQSIYSILASRYGCPRQDIGIYGEWRKDALNDKTVIYVHRRTYYDITGLLKK